MKQRRWSLLMTGENSGLVGPSGSAWNAHPLHYERVEVVDAAENEALKQSREDTIRDALTAAFNLGQVYWQQADSESIRANRKADETLARFHDLLDRTTAALAAKEE